jgi:Domain of unknown function (DUF4401)
MITTEGALFDELRARGLVAHEAMLPATVDAAVQRPWYIATLLGASGWFAGVFMLGFVAVLFQPDSALKAAVSGTVLLAAAWGLYKADRDAAFVAQLALALSLAGQCLMVYAMTTQTHGLAAVAGAALVLQAALALAMPNPLHRALSALFASIAWALLLRFAIFGEPGLSSADRAASLALAPALAVWLLAWLPIAALIGWLIRAEPAWMARGWQAVLRPIVHGLIVGLAYATLASEPFESYRAFGNAAAGPDWLALWPLLSALGALAALGAAYALRSRALIGACVVAMLLHVSHFYYELGASLLLKSLLMLAMGAAMLLAARLLARGVRA